MVLDLVHITTMVPNLSECRGMAEHFTTICANQTIRRSLFACLTELDWVVWMGWDRMRSYIYCQFIADGSETRLMQWICLRYKFRGLLIMIGQLNESFMFYPELPRGAELTLLTIYFVPFSLTSFDSLTHSLSVLRITTTFFTFLHFPHSKPLQYATGSMVKKSYNLNQPTPL